MNNKTNIKQCRYSKKDLEILVLHDVMDIIRDSVNKGRSKILGDSERAQISLCNEDSQKVFIMNVLELLSEVALCSSNKDTYLNFLIKIANNPQFEYVSVESLVNSANEFKEWLDKEILIEKMWLPDIDTELNLKIKRNDLILISGNSIKHGSNRLKSVRGKIKKILKDNNINIDKYDALILIENFTEWLYDDKLSYHITKLSELLNNIKYGIYDYLSLELKNNNNKIFYQTNKKEVKHFYSNLMNNTRRAPDFIKFKTTPLLTKRN